MKKTFILGVGAQKAGTTWLYSYINSYEKANLGFCKEYDIWNAIYINHHVMNDKKITLKDAAKGNLNQNQYKRFCMMHVPGFYEEYFNSILENGFNITGDITPSYSFLSADQYSTIRKKIVNMGVNIRVVFLMRDPFERCWSAVRMKLRNKARKDPSINTLKNEIKFLKSDYSNEITILDTKYENTYKNLKLAFNDDELYFGIYENMFTDGKLKEISKFLNIPFSNHLSNTYINRTIKNGNIPDTLKNEIRDFYNETYNFCYQKFPETKNLWGIV